jgi:hypothetical protein
MFAPWFAAAVAAPPAPVPAPPPTIEIVGQTKQGQVRLVWPGREGDTLFVDGWEWGALPVDTELAEGEHVFQVAGPKGEKASITVMLAVLPGQTTTVDLSRPPETPAAPVSAVPAVTMPRPAPADAQPTPQPAPAPAPAPSGN